MGIIPHRLSKSSLKLVRNKQRIGRNTNMYFGREGWVTLNCLVGLVYGVTAQRKTISLARVKRALKQEFIY